MTKKKKHTALAKHTPPAHSVPRTSDVVVVGGGASGLAAAISCAQTRRAQGAAALRIVVLEAAQRVGASIMRSGNGRCNFSNAHIFADHYHNAEEVARLFSANAADPCIPSVLAWFEALGLVWVEKAEGRLYPFSNKADSVLAVLTDALDELGIEVCTDARVVSARRERGGFALSVEVGARAARAARGRGGVHAAGVTSHVVSISARRVVVAAGGACPGELLAALGAADDLVPRRAMLAPLAAEFVGNVGCAPLDGIRMRARLTLPEWGFSEKGEVLFRSGGVSGIVAFNASRYAEPGDLLEVNLAPEMTPADLVALLARRAEALSGRAASKFFDGFVMPEVASEIVRQAQLEPAEPVSVESSAALAHAMQHLALIVQGIGDVRAAQVRRGGLSLTAIDAATCELVACAGAYVTGETLDVDAPCGGFNLHWAWETGLAAGTAVARSLA